MSDRKRAPLIAHLLAAPTGFGFERELVRDFWFGREEPWNATQDVKSRFLKLAYMYVASGVAHVGILGLLIAIFFAFVHTPQGASFQLSAFSMYVTGALTLATVPFGLLMALLEWREIMKQRRSSTDR
jgi:hypothetical protein